ncbi:MAG: hypothetical protein Ct9H300mP2_4270 [Candidatus Neomarinimicrobiota bacterium]|nr:MAG: hypothetical protein Ct9H300mP2_4270 [Candidatus Neomarinimicrobiota bacterium]
MHPTIKMLNKTQITFELNTMNFYYNSDQFIAKFYAFSLDLERRMIKRKVIGG